MSKEVSLRFVVGGRGKTAVVVWVSTGSGRAVSVLVFVSLTGKAGLRMDIIIHFGA